MKMLLVLCVLPFAALASPRARLAREAEEAEMLVAEARDVAADQADDLIAMEAMDMPMEAPMYQPHHPVQYHRLVYDAPNCTVENITVATKQCKTEFTKICEDVEVPVQSVDYEEECMNVTTTLCTPTFTKPEEMDKEDEEEEMADSDDPTIIDIAADAAEKAVESLVDVSDEEEGALKVRRAAEPLVYATHPFRHRPGLPLAPYHPLPYYQHCQDVTKEHCYKKPIYSTETQTKNICRKKPEVSCEDVELTVPKTTCVHVPHVPERIF